MPRMDCMRVGYTVIVLDGSDMPAAKADGILEGV